MHASSTYLCLGLLALVHVTLQATRSANPMYYVGAVVEYHPVRTGIDGTFVANENAKNYAIIVKKASEYNVDVIVFPEDSLTTKPRSSTTDGINYPLYSSYIPRPEEAEIPCGNSTSTVIEAVKTISCVAKDHSMYVVVNLRERENCTDAKCPKDGFYIYNTNVVFDRTGTIVARYRKYNLFDEIGTSVTTSPDISTFTTDFNVTFGQFVCFDILFEVPALTLLRKHNVTDILYSSHWLSELPYLTAIQIQSAWSYANDVNFLGSSYNDPSTGSGGSGIYAGTSGVLAAIWPEKRANVLLVARVPKIVDGRRASMDENGTTIYSFSSAEIDTTTHEAVEAVPQQNLLRDDVSAYTTAVINDTTSNVTTLCDRGLCCDFFVNVARDSNVIANSNANYYRYRFVVFNGVRTFSGVTTGGIQVCSIISCTNDTQTSCNRRFANNVIVAHPTTFRSIVISANFSTLENALQIPNTLTTDILSLNVTDFIYASNVLNSTHANVRLALTIPQSRLLTFAIYGRNFNADGSNVTKVVSSSGTHLAPLILVTILLTLGSERTYLRSWIVPL